MRFFKGKKKRRYVSSKRPNPRRQVRTFHVKICTRKMCILEIFKTNRTNNKFVYVQTRYKGLLSSLYHLLSSNFHNTQQVPDFRAFCNSRYLLGEATGKLFVIVNFVYKIDYLTLLSNENNTFERATEGRDRRRRA